MIAKAVGRVFHFLRARLDLDAVFGAGAQLGPQSLGVLVSALGLFAGQFALELGLLEALVKAFGV